MTGITAAGLRLCLLCLLLGTVVPAPAPAADRILVVGSSTVFPLSTRVGEHFAKSGLNGLPEIRVSSTGDGLKAFCAGSADGTPDVANASRRMSPAERSICAANGVGDLTEVRIGYDSLVLAGVAAGPAFGVSLDEFWRAIARYVPIDGAFVPNPYRSWREISRVMPDRPISIYGPTAGHGTRDTLEALVIEPRCMAAAEAVKLTAGQREEYCHAVRGDGAWIDTENLELILGKLASHPQAMGVLTYSYVEQFPNRIRAATIENIAPSRATISSAAYPISRPLYLYVKDAHLHSTNGLADYVAEFLSLCAAGADGYLLDEGLVPLPANEMRRQRALVARLQR